MKARQVLIVFHRMECRMENLPIEHLEIGSQVKHPPSFPWNYLFYLFIFKFFLSFSSLAQELNFSLLVLLFLFGNHQV